MNERMNPKFGGIYIYSASKHSGDIKSRPGVIVSKDSVNSKSDCVQIVPLTSDKEINEDFYAIRFLIPKEISSLRLDSVAMCDKATTILKSRIKHEVLPKLPENYIEQMKKCLRSSHENQPVLIFGAFGA